MALPARFSLDILLACQLGLAFGLSRIIDPTKGWLTSLK